MLGILKAGGAYLPIDPNYPAHRIDFLLADCAAPIVVAAKDTAEVIGGRHHTLVWIERDEAIVEPGARTLPPEEAARRRCGTISPTSSTPRARPGRPKGVLVTHRNVGAAVRRTTEHWFGFDEHDVGRCSTPRLRLLGVGDLGRAAVRRPAGRRADLDGRAPRRSSTLLRDERVTVLNQTPSAFRLLVAVPTGERRRWRPLALRHVIFGGEALDLAALRAVVRRGTATSSRGWSTCTASPRPRCTSPTGRSPRRIWTRPSASPIGVPIPTCGCTCSTPTAASVPDGDAGRAVRRRRRGRARLPEPPRAHRGALRSAVANGRQRLYRSGDLAARSPGRRPRCTSAASTTSSRSAASASSPARSSRPVRRSGRSTGGRRAARLRSRRRAAGRLRLPAPARTPATGQLRLADGRRHAEAHLPAHLRPSDYMVVTRDSADAARKGRSCCVRKPPCPSRARNAASRRSGIAQEE